MLGSCFLSHCNFPYISFRQEFSQNFPPLKICPFKWKQGWKQQFWPKSPLKIAFKFLKMGSKSWRRHRHGLATLMSNLERIQTESFAGICLGNDVKTRIQTESGPNLGCSLATGQLTPLQIPSNFEESIESEFSLAAAEANPDWVQEGARMIKRSCPGHAEGAAGWCPGCRHFQWLLWKLCRNFQNSRGFGYAMESTKHRLVWIQAAANGVWESRFDGTKENLERIHQNCLQKSR